MNKRRGRWDWWLFCLAAVGALVAWETLSRTGVLSQLAFPAPSKVASTLARLTTKGDLPGHLGATLSRLALGVILGAVPGVVVGLLMGWSRRFRAIIDPLIAAFHPVPKIAILPLVMLIFGIGEFSKVFLIGVSAFFPMAISAAVGVRQISPIHFEVAASYDASPFKVLTRVILPGSLPLLLSGARLAVNVALVICVATELVAARSGLGTMIWFAWETMRTEELYASILVVAVLGTTFNLLLETLRRRLVPWQPERRV